MACACSRIAPCFVSSSVASVQLHEHECVLLVNRYKEYLVAKEQKTEMLKAVDDKLSECERFSRAHEVACSICTIVFCLFTQLHELLLALNLLLQLVCIFMCTSVVVRAVPNILFVFYLVRIVDRILYSYSAE